MSTRESEGRAGIGRPGTCLLAGGMMLAVPTALALPALDVPSSLATPRLGLLITVVLAIGAAAVVASALQPQGGIMPALAVLCTVLALIVEPPVAIGDGLCGLACLGFLLAVRLHRQTRAGPVDLAQWLRAHRPMIIGAAVTTPAAVVAAAFPAAGWGLLGAALLGILCAVVAAAALTS